MEEKKYYTNERNVQIVIALLKEHGVRRVVVSPGTTNITLVASLMHDEDFELYSSVDERSAAYMACGLASESGEPVALSCTGATASRNYMPGLTEAYYRKLPIVAITSHQGVHRIGHLIAQNIDRRNLPADIAMLSVTLPVVKDKTDERFCEIEANKALLELGRNGGGPVHINLITTYSKDYSVKTLPPARTIHRFFHHDNLPALSTDNGHIAVFIGSHKEFTDKETTTIDAFCGTYDAVVFCDHTSGYHGHYAVHAALIFKQKSYRGTLRQIDTLIHIGEVSGDYDGTHFLAKEVWRISEDGELRDTFGRLTTIFQMREVDFFSHYALSGQTHKEFFEQCLESYNKILYALPELPFTNIWIAQQLSKRIPAGSQVHLGILNTLRSWNLFNFPAAVTSRSNVGGFGIDGIMSSLIGASLASPDKLFFGILGDLAFFYDMNVLGNRHVGRNVRILLVNNGRGTEFRNYDHPGARFGEAADDYIAAAGHYGHQSVNLVRHYAEDLGFEYLSASNKNEFLAAREGFVTPDPKCKPVLFECFTDSKDENDALYAVRNTIEQTSEEITKQEIKKAVESLLGKQAVQLFNKVRRK